MNEYFLASQKKQHRIFDTVGNQTGDDNMIGDYSSSPTKFYVRWEATDEVLVTGLRLRIESDSVFLEDGYGSLGALTNGIEIYTQDIAGNKIFHLTRVKKIHKLNDYDRWCQNAYPPDITSRKRFVYTWVASQWGHAFGVNACKGHHIVCELNSNFTGLTLHEMNLYCKVFNKEQEAF